MSINISRIRPQRSPLSISAFAIDYRMSIGSHGVLAGPQENRPRRRRVSRLNELIVNLKVPD
jgi:hypothetical protein